MTKALDECSTSPGAPAKTERTFMVRVSFFSYFKDLTGCERAEFEVHEGKTLADLVREVHRRFPKLEPMAKSTLVAVGVEYQDRGYVLGREDEVSLFPPVQGG